MLITNEFDEILNDINKIGSMLCGYRFNIIDIYIKRFKNLTYVISITRDRCGRINNIEIAHYNRKSINNKSCRLDISIINSSLYFHNDICGNIMHFNESRTLKILKTILNLLLKKKLDYC